jgi:asparagine N-glycosylation enzyme membrane subunit Stt3
MDDRMLTAFVIGDGMGLISTLFWPRLAEPVPFWPTSEFAVALVILLTAIGYRFVLSRRVERERLPVATIVLALVIFLVMLGAFSRLPQKRLQMVINPLRDAPPGDVSQTVAEHASMQLKIVNGKLDWPALKSYGVFLFLVPIGMVLPFMASGSFEDSNRNLLAFMVFVAFVLFMSLDPYASLITYAILWICIIALWYLTPEENRPNNEEMMMIIFALFAAYFFKNMIRLNILFSAFVAGMSGLSFGYGLGLLDSLREESSKRKEAELRMKERRKRRKKKRKPAAEAEAETPPKVRYDYTALAMGCVVVLLLGWSLSGAYTQASNYPLGLRQDWFQALDWIEENSEPDDVIMSWWDYGYWIQTYANRPTIADGATNNWTQIRRLARAFVTTETEAIQFCREFDVRYIMIDVSDDFVGGKWTAMAFIAKQNVNEYIGSQDGQPVVLEKGRQAPLFKMASREAMSQALPVDQHFEYKETFIGDRGGRVIVYEYLP